MHLGPRDAASPSPSAGYPQPPWAPLAGLMEDMLRKVNSSPQSTAAPQAGYCSVPGRGQLAAMTKCEEGRKPGGWGDARRQGTGLGGLTKEECDWVLEQTGFLKFCKNASATIKAPRSTRGKLSQDQSLKISISSLWPDWLTV